MAGQFDNFTYPHLKSVDPNYSPIEQNGYQLRLIKFELASLPESNGKPAKPYLKGTFAVTKDPKYSGRRLNHVFWNILDGGSRDMKDIKKFADATGLQQTDGQTFPQWVESVNQVAPEFKAEVFNREQTKWNGVTQTREVVVNEATGEPERENQINFRSASPV